MFFIRYCNNEPLSLQMLVSCMYQEDMSIVEKLGITGSAVVINQCDTAAIDSIKTPFGSAAMYSVTERGLTKSRNMAIEKATADICMLSDDDERFCENYRQKICRAYNMLPQADVIIFKVTDEGGNVADKPQTFPDKVMRLKFPQTMHVASWQISFRRKSLIESGVRFDELLGAGSGNGAQEELKFLLDCERAGLKIYYVPFEIARVQRTDSTWFGGFDESFFEQRGATTRYILGFWLSSLYAVYYVLKKHDKFEISAGKALAATFKGIFENKIKRQLRQRK